MKNRIISLLIILFMSVSAISLGSVFSDFEFHKISNQPQLETQAAAPASSPNDKLEVIGDATYVSFNKVYDSVSTGASGSFTGLVSYLTINYNPTNMPGLTNFKIKRAIGSVTYNIDTDELGKNISGNGLYHFTRQATYIVSYNIGSVTYSSQCFFSPEINEPVLKSTSSLTQQLKNIQYINDSYYIIGDGLSEISQTICFNTSLYDLYINDNTTAETINATNTYTLKVPANCYGPLTLTFSSKKGFLTRKIDITVINASYQHSFVLYNEDGTISNKDYLNYAFGTEKSGVGINKREISKYYVFNSKVTLNLTLSDNLLDTNGVEYKYFETTGSASEEEIASAKATAEQKLLKAKTECVNLLNLYSTETIRNASNSASAIQGRVLAETPEGPMWSVTFDAVDHSIYKMSTALSFSTNTIINSSIVNFKIITKVPQVSDKYDFAVFLTGSNTTAESLNYINSCLDGYLYDGTVIHTQNSYTAINSSASGKLYTYDIVYKGSNTGTSSSSTMVATTLTFIDDDVTRFNPYQFRLQTTGDQIENDLSFEEFYAFNFNITYHNNSPFYYYCLTEFVPQFNNYYLITGLTTSPTIKALNNKQVNINGNSNAILNYDTDCLPVYIQVTYNEKVYEDIHKLKSGDELWFTEYGSYVLELYTFPSYEFTKNFVEYWLSDKNSTSAKMTLSNYYVRMEFEIDGPSITVTSKDNDGNPLVITNNMYTNHGISFDVTLREELGESLEIYKDNEFYYSSNTSENDRTIDKSGTWKMYVLDANKNVLKSLTFSICDSSYQGFSINYHEDYEDFVVYKYDSESTGYKTLDPAYSYHLIDAGRYRIKITNGEKLYFNHKNGNSATSVLSSSNYTTNYINFDVVDPFFNITLATGAPGTSITENVEITGVNGLDIQLVEVFRNGKAVGSFAPSDMNGLENLLGSTTSFSDTGVYTIRVTDRFNNAYEIQVQKYYKANIALILLVIITAFGLVFLVYFIFRSKRGLKVK